MRTVGNNYELAHVWAQGAASVAGQPAYMRTANNSMEFDGSTIFSYGRHFAIAHHVTNKRGDKAVLFTHATYSNTTSKHCGIVHGAIADGTTIFSVRDLTEIYRNFKHGETPSKTILLSIFNYYIQEAKKDITEAVRSRSSYRIDLHFQYAKQKLEKATEFARFYSMRHKVPSFDSLANPEALQKAKDKLAEDRKANAERLAKEREDQKKRAAKQREKERLSFEAWQNGDSLYCPWSYNKDEDGSAYLRLHNGFVETSQRASVPEAHGRRAYRFIKLCRMMSRPFHKNGRTVRVGHYTFTSIDAEGNSIIGCHVISWKRLDEFAKIVGWSHDLADDVALTATEASV